MPVSPQGRRVPAFALLLWGTCLHGAGAQSVPEPWSACARAAAEAERDAGIPAGLLLAVGKVESGRTDPATGQASPWPYAVNVAGEGRHLPDPESAVAHVRLAQARGVRSIDAGCFQISLLHHPQAFTSLEQAFDPARNAAYAAQFLASLQRAAGSWELAVGRYHSMTAAFAEPYAARVLAVWTGRAPLILPRQAGPAASFVPAVRVYGPGGWTLPGAAPGGVRRLPAVYVPGMR